MVFTNFSGRKTLEQNRNENSEHAASCAKLKLPAPTVAVIDSFNPRTNVIYQPALTRQGSNINQGMVSHGEVVSGIIRAEGVAVKEVPLPVLPPKTLTSEYWQNVADTVSQVADAIEQKKPEYQDIKVVNMSLGHEVKLNDLREILGQENLEVQDIVNNKGAIIEGLRQAQARLVADVDTENNKKGKVIVSLLNVVKQINRLTDLGQDVCIAAGNEGTDSINMLALSEKARIVGVDEYFANPAIVSDKEKGNTVIVPVADKQGETGYDLNNDNIIDIPRDLSDTGIPIGHGTIKKVSSKTGRPERGIYNQADVMKTKPGDENYEFFKERYYEYGNPAMNQGYYFKVKTQNGSRLILGDLTLSGTSYAAPRLAAALAKKKQQTEN